MGNLKRKDIKDLNIIKDTISNCEVVRLAMCEDNTPYMVPLNYGYEFDENNNLVLYCHFANIGKKVDILLKNPNVFIEIDNQHNIIKDKNSYDCEYEYLSIMSNGKVEFIHNIYDKVHGLNKIMDHSASNLKNKFKNEVLNKIFLLKITCNNLSAKKCKI